MLAGELYEHHVDILAVRFPCTTRAKAVAWTLERIAQRLTTPVAFPDMSTLNLASRDPAFRRLLQERFFTLNDGAGLAWAARRQGHPLGDNLNGTDFAPLLFAGLEAGTRVCLVGASRSHLEGACLHVAASWPHVHLVGAWNGYQDYADEKAVLSGLVEARPHLVLVALGNPEQVRFIDRHVDDVRLQGVTWLAVGGLLDYWCGANARAPHWMRTVGLEWAWIMVTQPRKLRRYLMGVPSFMTRCILAEATHEHLFAGTPLWGG